MAIHAGGPVTAGLSQVARMSRRERARLVRDLAGQHSLFRALWRRLMLARAIAFTSVVLLAAAVVLVLQREVPAEWVSVLVLGGLGGFAHVAIVLSDHRFDLLLAVLGAHRTDELHDRLLGDELYGADHPEDGSGSAEREPGWERRAC
ncbi:hypothetical protein ACL03H_18795 [Saccharopolyspora sp. MS10]|uniref:hypothetical protein n=1 Tax=Saccharopolyspora sp. MS10 TaxID=3385973 RepID=UPI0039A35871